MSLKTVAATEWSEAAARLASRLENLVATDKIREGAGRGLTLKADNLPRLDLLHWLSCQEAGLKLYWLDRERQFEAAGLWAAEEIITNLSDLCASPIPAGEHPPYFGGCRFDLAYPAEVWSKLWENFHGGIFVLPLVLLQRRGNEYSLACHVDRTAGPSDVLTSISPVLADLTFDEAAPPLTDPGPYHRTDQPEFAGWKKSVDAALKMFHRGEAQKIVLARETRLDFEQEASPWPILNNLRKTAASCYLFGFQPVEGTAFIGASPERLYRRVNREIKTEAVAGTRPRGGDDERDLELQQDLLYAAKDRHEHNLVTDSLHHSLEDLCERITGETRPSILKLSRVQHLSKTITGRLKRDATDGDILTRLHPTPAVGGFPRQAALEAIRELEGFDRGWYAGPIGWLSNDEAEFAVAIRSGLVQGRTLTLYSGAGIVPGSVAEDEWQEIEQKMSGFLEAVVGKKC